MFKLSLRFTRLLPLIIGLMFTSLAFIETRAAERVEFVRDFAPSEGWVKPVEHLPLGYRDFTRLPNTNDGVWFKPFEEGKPGVQPERLPPYVCTLNPGWDAALPLYKPLAMFEAQKAAQAPGTRLTSPWDRKSAIKTPVVGSVPATIEQVAFVGVRDGELFKRLASLGVPLVDVDGKDAILLIADAATLTNAALAQQAADATLANRGTVLVLFREAGELSAAVSQLLPAPAAFTSRRATALVSRPGDVWTAGLGLTNLYFAEEATDKQILKCGLTGPFVEQERVLLEASATDWALFIDAPENAKYAAVVLHEQLIKPGGAALVAASHRGGIIAVSSVDYLPDSPARARLWRTLFANMGVRLKAPSAADESTSSQKNTHNLLLDGPAQNKP